MPTITFQPENISIDVPPGTELLQAARKAKIEIDSPCGGKGTCGKCIVKIVSGQADSDSLGVLSQTAVSDGFVLACRTKLLDQNLVVQIPEQIGYKDGQFAEIERDTHLVRRELLPKDWQYDPLALKWVVDVPPANLEDGLSDIDRLTKRLQLDWGPKPFIYPLKVIQSVADVLRTNDGQVTVTLIRQSEQYHVVNIEPGDRTVRHYGIAIDIGTTTIAVQLVFLPLAKIIATRTDYNSQITCGLDVISRINYAQTPERLEELRERVLNTINHLVTQVASNHNVKPEEISNAVIAGNTTMVHLLLGLKPEYIRLYPYTPTVMEAPYLTAREVGIAINPQSWVCISPCVGSYVGGDITAGLLCTDIATPTEDIHLFIDIGTNGELVLGNSDFLMACACSAGPAFEGGGIEHGMRAAVGAIENVEIDAKTGKATYWTIGNVKPKGICGSGMISLLANLFLTGWIDAAGKFNRNRAGNAIRIDGRKAFYIIVPKDLSGTGKPIWISETDIENIIRAKAAIYSACSLMLEQIGLEFENISSIYIAGGFGRYMDIEKAKIIGLIPDLDNERYHYIGNSSLMGAYMVLVSREYRELQLNLAKRMTYVELNTDPTYMDQYTGALFLPHTDKSRFPSVVVPNL